MNPIRFIGKSAITAQVKFLSIVIATLLSVSSLHAQIYQYTVSDVGAPQIVAANITAA
ncbi:MAG: hypothetical protein RL220_2064, partial [Bacteroidota bacterium]